MATSSQSATWRWDARVRTFLTIVAGAGALALLAAAPSRRQASAQLPALVVDPNHAPAAVLGALPRLGPSLVGRIIAARNRAPLRSLDDLDRRVQGIGPATISALRPFLRFDTGPH